MILVDERDRVLVGRRHLELPFMGGFEAFPGGAIEPEDDGADSPPDPFFRAAVRELLEETGIDLTSSSPTPAVVSWTTPDTWPIRFETRFFLARAPAEPRLSASGEMDRLRFEAPETLLTGYRQRRIMAAPPTLFLLEALCETRGSSLPERRNAMQAVLSECPEPGDHLEPVCGIRQLPLRTPTLPPALHTNCFIVGHERLVLVDPATYLDEERERLRRRVAALDVPVEAVVLTHHHRDHVGSAQWASDAFSAPIWAHPKTAQLLPELRIDRALDEGDRLDLGFDAAGDRFELDMLFTPGHAPGHLVLRDLRPGLAPWIVGDMVAGVGTIIVDPDEGDMGEYIRQLERMRAFEPGPLLPSHGGPIAASTRKLDRYVEHRLLRESKVLDALRRFGGPARAADLLPVAYEDTPTQVWPLAERSCLAHLVKLANDGQIRRVNERFSI